MLTRILDTNICVYIINQRPEKVLQKFQSYQIGEIGISSITLAELKYDAYKSQREEQNLAVLEAFVTPLELLSFGANSADAYGRIRADLEHVWSAIFL